MTKIIAMLAKRLAVISGPVLAWAAVAIIAGYLALIATVGVLNWRLNLAQEGELSAEVRVQVMDEDAKAAADANAVTVKTLADLVTSHNELVESIRVDRESQLKAINAQTARVGEFANIQRQLDSMLADLMADSPEALEWTEQPQPESVVDAWIEQGRRYGVIE